MPAVEERLDKAENRLDKIEQMIMELVYIQHKTEMELQELKKEMKEFKDEMKEFKDEMKEFKDEMKNFKDEMKAEVKRMNKQWGELANKMGTIVEDIVYPATRPVLEKYFKCEINQLMANIKKKLNDYKDEFDIIAVSDKCKKVFLVEVKSTIRENHITQWIFQKIDSLKQLFPEYKDYKIVPILATLRAEEDKLNLATKHKVYIMAYREWEYMDLINFNNIV
ncbi:hypothetical protein [Hydrogenivirga sp. 128-5-R1-1]|uniref:hypothetical protein n=1 Tax=Hydrogenivirga sp. 128-5-R1-1 TaxID=392423 RepID=UPI00015F0C84|nr:hypothetical protein [Hydrogenivirga sp. 128-5-R1-1]EDP73978.1 hypothetical protein HG1285_11917 [Hydrogenivirga sp. 128-5-R1-1]